MPKPRTCVVRATMAVLLRRKLMALRCISNGKAIRKGVLDRARLPSSAGVAIWDTALSRTGLDVVGLFHSRIRDRTFSLVLDSFVAFWRLTLIKSRAKSAGLVVRGQSNPRVAKCESIAAPGPEYTGAPPRARSKMLSKYLKISLRD